MANLPTRDELLAAVQNYDRCIHDPRVPERQVNEALLGLVALVPHSYISDLLHYGERPRTDVEVTEEARLREQLWRENGEVALIEHLTKQFHDALSDPELPYLHRSYSERMLQRLWGEAQ